jgi:HAD superfamily hydrolase (TIGR01549 family)
MTIRAVFFDLGDTLWHFPEMPPIDLIRGETVRRISDLLRTWGVNPEGELFLLGRDIRIAIERAVDEAYNGDCISPHFPTVAREVAAAKGLAISEQQAVQLWHTWNLGGVFLGRALFPDVVPTLQWLRKRGYRIGSVTNRALGGEPFRQELSHYGLLDYFEVLSISCDVGYMKPHAAIFQHALEALAVAPEEAVMVGDSMRADVAGAQALGMTAVWKRNHSLDDDEERPLTLPNGQGPVVVIPDYTVETLGELPGLPIFC